MSDKTAAVLLSAAEAAAKNGDRATEQAARAALQAAGRYPYRTA
jgi:hypothetical protein